MENRVMNLSAVHESEKPVSAKKYFSDGGSDVLCIQILESQLLKEHITKIPARLLCVSGKVSYKDEQNENHLLTSGQYIDIIPFVKHWVEGIENSQLILIK